MWRGNKRRTRPRKKYMCDRYVEHKTRKIALYEKAYNKQRIHTHTHILVKTEEREIHDGEKDYVYEDFSDFIFLSFSLSLCRETERLH